MFNAFAFLKCSKKCQGNIQKPGLSASGDNVFFYFFFLFFFFFNRGRRFATMQLNIKFLRKEEMLPKND